MKNGTDPGLVMTDTYGNDTVLDTVKLPDGRERLQVDVVTGGGGGGASVDVSALATEATLLALKNAVLAQTEIASTLWTDDSGSFYVRRDTMNEQTGVVVVGWFTPQGATSPGPGTGIRPASGSKDYEITSTLYTATAGGTGYSNGDTLIHALVLEVSGSSPVVAASIWLNVTTGLLLGAAPSGGNVTVNAPLPTGASTAARQDAMKTTLDSILTALGSQATATKQDLSKTVLDNILTKLSADPATATLQGTANTALAAIQTALGSQATATLQGTANTLLGQIKAAIEAQGGGGGGSVPTGAAGTPNAAVMSVQGIAGGKTVKAAPEIDMQVTSGVLEEHVYAAGELWTVGNIYMAGSRPKQAILDGLLIIVGGNHTCDLDVLFVRYDNYGGANAPVVGTTMASIANTLVNSVWATATLEPSMTIGGYTVYEAHGLGIVLKDWFLNSYIPVLAAPRNGSMTIGAATNKSPRLVTHLTFPANA